MPDDYIRDRELQEAWAHHETRYGQSYKEIRAARDLLSGKSKAPLDASILPGSADREALRSSLPQKYTTILKMLNKLIERAEEIKREPVGTGIRAETVATKIEQIDNGAADQSYPDAAVGDLLLNEGQAAVITMPAIEKWDHIPALYKDDDQTKMDSAYEVDGQGRGPEDDHYSEPGTRRQFKAHARQSTKYFDSVKKDYQARNIPIVQEAVSRLDLMIPINPHYDGKDVVVDGLIRKRKFMKSELVRRGYSWGTDGHLEPTDSLKHGDIELIEGWFNGPNGPYVSYHIDKADITSKKGEPAVVDLGKDYGLSCLPIAYGYGWDFPGLVDPDLKGIPFANVYGRSWLNLDTLFTSLMVMAFREANMFLFYKPDIALTQHFADTDFEEHVTIKGNTVTRLLGDLQRMSPSNQIPQLESMIAMLSGKQDEELPSKQAFGGGGNSSAIGRNTAEDDAMGMIQQVRESKKRMKARSMAHWNEQAACIGKKRGNIQLFINSDIPQEERKGRASSTRSVVEVDPKLFGEPPVWEVDAIIPGKITDTDKLALRQQLLDAWKAGAIPLQWVLEHGYSDPAPDVTIKQRLEEDAMLSPEGRAMILRDAAIIAGDEQTAMIMEGIAAKVLLVVDPSQPPGPENVMPTSMLAGVGGQPSAMPGVTQSNIAASQLGGMVGGAINAPAAQGVNGSG